MKRREFIRNTALAAAGVVVAPYILPSGRLFARSGARLANHVVFVLYAGGLRNQETVDQLYVATQGLPTQGNVMPNLLKGAAPNSGTLVYRPWDPILKKPLSEVGTLFSEMRYASGPTGHFNGHTVAMTGNYTETGLNLNINPEWPTVFEYYRKHNDPAKSAMNAWWLSEGLGPFPSLNYSSHAQYGPQYGANYLRPYTTFLQAGSKYFANIPSYQPDDVARIGQLRTFLDNSFQRSTDDLPGIQNRPEDRQRIAEFIQRTVQDTFAGKIPSPVPDGMDPMRNLTGDLVNISYAWQVLNEFEPELIVINTFNSDVCHDDFSAYLSNLHRADYGVGWLWDKIQSHPRLANDTIMICMPEHGRNLQPNALVDSNGFRAFDHTSDDNSRRVFGLIAGPQGVVKQNLKIGTEGRPVGETIDIVPTVAHILGFKDSIPSGMLPGRVLEEAFA